MLSDGDYGIPHYLPGRDRVLCDVLDEMRTCYKTRNFASLEGLIEEAQGMGNRMESALSDKRTYGELCSILKSALKRLRDGKR